MGEQIPVIDLKECESQPQKLRLACEEWGTFRLINHGISTELMAEMKRVTKELLDLPVEIKQRNKDVLPGSGYMAPSKTNPVYEALGLFDAGSSVSVATFFDHLEASPHQRETINKYAQEIHNLAIDISCRLAKSMGVATYSFDGWPCQLRINRYTFKQENIGTLGVELHTDSGFLTILQDDENHGGLEIMNQSGTFVAVSPWPGAFVVNLGDMVVPWSNGRLRSLLHRVQCKGAGLRFSVATFLLPPADEVFVVPQEFIDSEHPSLFLPFKYEAYRRIRASNNLYTAEALKMLRAEQ